MYLLCFIKCGVPQNMKPQMGGILKNLSNIYPIRSYSDFDIVSYIQNRIPAILTIGTWLYRYHPDTINP